MTDSATTTGALIHGIALVVSDLERSVAFYCNGLGFALNGRGEGGSPASTEALLDLGGVSLRLIQFAAPGAPYPSGALANDPWFQHFAIRVRDMGEAYARLLSHGGHMAISTGGPQQLPPSTGSVIAYKFRDPDGHPLELSHLPGRTTARSGSLFIAIDHSAIVVSDVDKSVAFYTDRLGFDVAGRSINQGPSQWRLDGLDGAIVDIVVLESLDTRSHLELLHYRAPCAVAARNVAHNDIAATRLLVTANGSDKILADPDGHLIERAKRFVL